MKLKEVVGIWIEFYQHEEKCPERDIKRTTIDCAGCLNLRNSTEKSNKYES